MGEKRLTAIKQNCLTLDCTIMEGSTPVARIDSSWFRGNVVLTVDDASYHVYREKGSRDVYLLVSDGDILARAIKPHGGRREIGVELADGKYTLKARNAFSGDFVLFRDSTAVGSITSEGFFKRRARVSLPEDLPLPAGVFFLWLVLMIWKDDSDMIDTQVIDIPPQPFS